jgi:hypothetical protein
MSPGRTVFDRFARWTERQLGRSVTFALAFLSVGEVGSNRSTLCLVRYLAARHQYRNNDRHVSDGLRYSEYPSRDTQALQLKLDELIRVNKTARNSLISLEERSESEVEQIKSAFSELSSAGGLPVEAPAPSVRRGPVAAEF